MKRITLAIVAYNILWGSAMWAERCAFIGEVLPLAQHDKRTPDSKLMTVKLLAHRVECGREVSEYQVMTVETKKSHRVAEGEKIILRSTGKTPRGKLLVEVVAQ